MAIEWNVMSCSGIWNKKTALDKTKAMWGIKRGLKLIIIIVLYHVRHS